jgi:pimeloyl-ACP methyl ester carboxylesterase
VVESGPQKGPLVLLLHGFPEHWYSWRHQISALAKAGFRVIAPDQRGYNLSEKPASVEDYAIDTLTRDVAGLIHAVGRKEAVIVGHDWGGVVAYRFAMDYPRMTKKLVILNAPHPRAFAREIKKFRQLRKSWYMYFFQLPGIPEIVFDLSPFYWARRLFREKAVNKKAFSDKDLQIMAKANAQQGAMHSMINWYRAAFRIKPLHRTQPIRCPALVIWGKEDFALGVHLTDGLEPWFQGSFRLEKIPRCGHWVQNEAAEKVNQLLLDFLL